MHASMKRLHQVSGLTRKKDIADALGVAQSTVTNWGTRGVSKEAALDAAELYGVEARYILDGNTAQEMAVVAAAQASNIGAGKMTVSSTSLPSNSNDLVIHRLPVLNSIFKGLDIIRASVDWIEKPITIADNGFALVVSNRAMNPDFAIGDYAVVDPNIDANHLKDGDYVVAQHNDDNEGDVFKVVLFRSNDIRLVQTNEQLGDMIAIPVSDYHVFGIVDRKVTKFR